MAGNRKVFLELGKTHAETPVRAHAQTARLPVQDPALI